MMAVIKRAVLAVLTAAVLCFTASAAAVPRYHYEVRRDLSVYFTNADKVIEAVRGALKRRQERIVIEYSSHGDNMGDVDKLVSEIMHLAQSETDRADEGDYISGQLGGYTADFSRTKSGELYSYTLTIRPDYYSDREQELKVEERVREIVEGFGLADNADEFARFKAVYNYVYDNVDYDIIHKNNEHYHLKSTAYGALFNKHAVCQGYAVTMYRLLREVGIDCRVIKGMAYNGELGGEYHAWNIVKLGGKYYSLDVTWNKQLETEDFFLKGENDFEGHEPDEEFLTEEFRKSYEMADRNYPA